MIIVKIITFYEPYTVGLLIDFVSPSRETVHPHLSDRPYRSLIYNKHIPDLSKRLFVKY